jgi:hypothetical protein
VAQWYTSNQGFLNHQLSRCCLASLLREFNFLAPQRISASSTKAKGSSSTCATQPKRVVRHIGQRRIGHFAYQSVNLRRLGVAVRLDPATLFKKSRLPLRNYTLVTTHATTSSIISNAYLPGPHPRDPRSRQCEFTNSSTRFLSDVRRF